VPVLRVNFLGCVSGVRDKFSEVEPEKLRIEDWNALLGVEDMRLPDGLVEGTTPEDWQRLLDCLTGSAWRVVFQGDEESVPIGVAEMFASDISWIVSVELTCAAVVKFFLRQPTSIDFDFDLGEIEGQIELNEILQLVRLVGQQAKRDVGLLYESTYLAAL
jgi:hypothetical protein